MMTINTVITTSSLSVAVLNVVATDDDNPPTVTELIGNYPNPFSSSTTISFSLATNLHENARIEIFNIKGQKVETFLINPSTHQPIDTITWNSSKYSNGIYFYKLETDNKSFIKKMILMR